MDRHGSHCIHCVNCRRAGLSANIAHICGPHSIPNADEGWLRDRGTSADALINYPLLTLLHSNFAVSSSDTSAATEGTEETPVAPKDSSTHNPLIPLHLGGIVDPLVDTAPGTEGTNEPPTAQRGSPIRPLLTPLCLDFVGPSSGTSTAKEGTEETPVVQKDSQNRPPPGTETDMGVDGRVSTPGQSEDIEAGPPSLPSPLSPIGSSRSPSPTSSARATIECTLDEEQRARGKLLDQIDLSGLPEWAAKAHATLTQDTKNLNMAMRCVLADWVWLESTFATVSPPRK